jgi:hypothetical protein
MTAEGAELPEPRSETWPSCKREHEQDARHEGMRSYHADSGLLGIRERLGHPVALARKRCASENKQDQAAGSYVGD